MKTKAIVSALSLTAGAIVCAPTAWGQAYPNKPVRLVIAQAAGSATDTAGRIIAQKLSELLGQQVIVDNRAGAGGLLGTEMAAKAPPDGYTLLLSNISTHGVNPALYKKLPYDAVKDFTPVSLATITPNVLVVHPSVPVRNTKEFIAFAKARPGQLNFATPGNGSSQHLATELFRSMAGGITATHVPYKGSPPAMTAVISGESSWMIPTLTLSLPHIKSQRVRALGVTSTKRLEEMPDLPTVAETLPGYEVVSWYGVSAPAGTPSAVVNRLNSELAKVLAMPDVQKSLATSGMTVQPSTPEEFGAFVRNEVAKWMKVAREANIQLE